MKNFQAESKKSGDEFEDLVELDIKAHGGDVVYKNYQVPNTGVEVDFVATRINQHGVRIELIECKGGKAGDKKRPGAERTDNVKKAVANGAILKFINPDLYYVVYFSAKPKGGSYADHMLEIAMDAGYIDEIRYL